MPNESSKLEMSLQLTNTPAYTDIKDSECPGDITLHRNYVRNIYMCTMFHHNPPNTVENSKFPDTDISLAWTSESINWYTDLKANVLLVKC